MIIGLAKFEACQSMWSIRKMLDAKYPFLVNGMELADLGPAMAPLELNEDLTPKQMWPVRQIRATMDAPGRIELEWLIVAWTDGNGNWQAIQWPGDELPRIPGVVQSEGEWILPVPVRVGD